MAKKTTTTTTTTQTPGGTPKTTTKKSTGSRICMWPERTRRRTEAEALKQIARNQTPQERLQTLDDRLGYNQGAKRERTKLKAKLA